MAKAETVVKSETAPKVGESKVDETKVTKWKGQKAKLYEDHKNTSGVIRYLSKEGLTTSEIAKVVDKRYQHVRNVLITPVGKKVAPVA